jgi:hypothetical protein
MIATLTTPTITPALPSSVRGGPAAARANPFPPLPPHSQNARRGIRRGRCGYVAMRTLTGWHRAEVPHALSP